MRRVIFLDIDGVLTNHDWSLRVGDLTAICPDNVAALNDVLRAVPDAEICVTSQKRIFLKTLGAMVEYLMLRGVWASRITDITPWNLPEDKRVIAVVGPRGYEITEWLRMQEERGRPVDRYVVLDDSSDASEGHETVFVRTSFDGGGLTAEHAARAIAILEG